MTSLTRRIGLAAAVLGLLAGASGRAEAGLITFTYSGPSVFPGEPGATTGSGSFSFDDPRTSLARADLTAFSYVQSVVATFAGAQRQTTFAFGLADLTSFSATLGPGGVPTSLALTTRPVAAADPAFFAPETFVVFSLAPDGAATFNVIGQQLTRGTVTLTPTANPVPEPSTLALGGVGMLTVLGVAWRRRRAA
jgi:hypothetical protein